MNVLVIPEDFRKDQYILKPLVQAMLTHLGRPRANVRVCQDPLLRGISQAMDRRNILDILERYCGMVHVFLLLVDRDGEAGRRAALDDLEAAGRTHLERAGGRVFYAEHAWQEVEVWALAACDKLPAEWRWRDIRSERDVKEAFFDPLVEKMRLRDEPGEGRLPLGKLIPPAYERVRTLCPEDVQALEMRLSAFMETR